MKKTFIFILLLENNLYLCNVLDKIRDKQWTKDLYIFCYAALLFYWQSQREVSVVHKSMCEQWYTKAFLTSLCERFFLWI